MTPLSLRCGPPMLHLLARQQPSDIHAPAVCLERIILDVVAPLQLGL